jgi:ubiquitin carboxyl-terminal hydrolase 7
LHLYFYPENVMLLLRFAISQDLRPIAPPEKTKEDILLFIKLYDPEKQELRYLIIFGSCLLSYLCPLCSLESWCLWHDKLLHDPRYVGRLFVKNSSKPIEILAKLNQMAGFASEEEIELYEVCLYQVYFVS